MNQALATDMTYANHVPVSLTKSIEQDLGGNHHDLGMLRHLGPVRLGQLMGPVAPDLDHRRATVPADGGGLLPHERDIRHDKDRNLFLVSLKKRVFMN